MALKIAGTGGRLPEFVLDNHKLSTMVDTTEEWITTRTGIHTRRIITTETLLDLASGAAQDAISSAKCKAVDIDLIICATVLGDTLTPNVASMVQKRIGAVCPAFDINAACSGFVFALDIAAAYIKSGLANRILLIGAEHISNITDYTDRASCILFGDGAGAVVVERGDNLLAHKLVTKGDDSILKITRMSGNFPHLDPSNTTSNQSLWMNGQEVYKFAVEALIQIIHDVLDLAKLKIDDIDYFVPHQANKRIIEGASKRLGLSESKTLSNIAECGNTSSACIPLMLDTNARMGRFKPGDILLLAAFGGGMACGAAIIKW